MAGIGPKELLLVRRLSYYKSVIEWICNRIYANDDHLLPQSILPCKTVKEGHKLFDRVVSGTVEGN